MMIAGRPDDPEDTGESGTSMTTTSENGLVWFTFMLVLGPEQRQNVRTMAMGDKDP